MRLHRSRARRPKRSVSRSFVIALEPALGDSRQSRLGLPDPNDVVGEPYGEDSRWRGLAEELS
jgi:hypothetical protein